MKKLFISQPMRGKSDEEILAVRARAVESAERHLGEKVEVIDSFFQEAPVDANPLWYLSKSLELLATADVAYFAPGWDTARGCKIENQCATEYGITVIEDYRERSNGSKPITISREQFKDVAADVIVTEVANPELHGASKLLIPIVGSIFVSKVEDKLFGKEDK